LLSGQPYLGGEAICTSAHSHTVGLPLALGCTVKGLSVGLLSGEHPPSIANTHPMSDNRINLRKLQSISTLFPPKGWIQAGSAYTL
jgi:hypothetical protein